MNKEQLIKELNQMIKEGKYNAEEFEKTHDFDYISQYNIYSVIEFIEDILKAIQEME